MRVGGRGSFSEELPEVGIVGEGPDACELELEQRKMRLVEVDAIDLRRLRGELGTTDVQLQELESILTALEKLAPREEAEPEKIVERAREKEVAKRRLAALS